MVHAANVDWHPNTMALITSNCGGDSTSAGPVAPLGFTFHSRGPGTYKGVFLLRRDDPTKVYSDVRVYEVSAPWSMRQIWTIARH